MGFVQATRNKIAPMVIALRVVSYGPAETALRAGIALSTLDPLLKEDLIFAYNRGITQGRADAAAAPAPAPLPTVDQEARVLEAQARVRELSKEEERMRIAIDNMQRATSDSIAQLEEKTAVLRDLDARIDRDESLYQAQRNAMEARAQVDLYKTQVAEAWNSEQRVKDLEAQLRTAQTLAGEVRPADKDDAEAYRSLLSQNALKPYVAVRGTPAETRWIRNSADAELRELTRTIHNTLSEIGSEIASTKQVTGRAFSLITSAARLRGGKVTAEPSDFLEPEATSGAWSFAVQDDARDFATDMQRWFTTTVLASGLVQLSDLKESLSR